MTDNISVIEVDSELYEKASQKVEDINKYIEQELQLLVNNDFSDEFDVLVELSMKMEEIKELETRLINLRENRIGKVINNQGFEDCMSVITRIHDNLDMIGKNQIKSIAKRNNVPYDVLLELVKREGYNIVNYTGITKK